MLKRSTQQTKAESKAQLKTLGFRLAPAPVGNAAGYGRVPVDLGWRFGDHV